MKKIVIELTYYVDIIEVPDFIEEDLDGYIKKFNKWAYNKNNRHKYWVIENGKLLGVEIGGETFVYFLNTEILMNCEEKARVVEEEVKEYDESLPKRFF